MKKLLLLPLFFLFAAAQAFAQSGDLVVYNNDGYAFYLIVNGQRQNNTPETQVRVYDLRNEFLKVNIIWEDENLQPLMNKSIALTMGQEMTYTVKRNNKGNWVIRFAGEAARQQQVVQTQPVQTQPVQTNGAVVNQTVTTTTSSSTSTTTTSSGTTEQVNVNMGVDGVNIGFNVSVQETENGVNMNTQGGGVDVNIQANDPYGSSSSTYQETTTVTTSSSVPNNTQVVSANGCAYPMNSGDFASAKGSIASKTFADSKMKVARQIAKSNCLTSIQVREIVSLFDFEDDRLTFAKFAYDYTFDPNNYYKVNDAFEFESTIEDLDEYISH